MDLKAVIQKLEEVERELLAQLSLENTNYDYDAKQALLNNARNVGSVKGELEVLSAKYIAPNTPQPPLIPDLESKTIPAANMPPKPTTPLATSPTITPEKHAPENQFPVYFVLNDNLYKIGERNTGAKRFYKKVVPWSEVKQITEKIADLARQSVIVRVAQLYEVFPDYPDYKVQCTLLALVAAKALENSGRGKYSANTRTSSEISALNWLSALKNLPPFPQFLEEAKA